MDTSDADAFARLAHEMHEQETFEETIELVVESAPALVGSDYASFLLARRSRQFEVGAATDALAEKADRLQVQLNEGPAITAALERQTLVVTDVLQDPRWPQWSAGMEGIGIRSAVVVRLWTSHSTLGALSLYAARPDWFDASAVGISEILGRHASIALASARQETSLIQAVDARKLVGQAQGILMERYDLDDRRAFDVLRRYSQDHNIKLAEVARLLVSTGKLPRS